jgi:hypothetical protein
LSETSAPAPVAEDVLGRIEVKVITTVRRAERMALSLRMAESLLARLLEAGLIPDGEDLDETMKRREELLAIARWIEEPAKAVRPQAPRPVIHICHRDGRGCETRELPKHERRKRGPKLVALCQGAGCDRALTREQSQVSELCPVCRQKSTTPL